MLPPEEAAGSIPASGIVSTLLLRQRGFLNFASPELSFLLDILIAIFWTPGGPGAHQ